MKTFYSFMLAVCMLAGCTSTQSSGDSAAVPCDSLAGRAVQVDSVLFRYAYRIRVQDDVAVVFDMHHPAYYCHAFTYPDFKYLSSFAPLGEGPEEVVSGSDVRFLGPNRVAVLDSNGRKIAVYNGVGKDTQPTLQRMVRMDESDRVAVLDSNGRKIAVYNGVGKDTQPTLQRMVRMDESVLMPLDFIPLSGGSFLVPDNSGEHRFSMIDSCGKVKGSSAVYPLSEKELLATAAPAVSQAWRSFLAAAPKQDRLVAVTQLGDVMDCYNLPNPAEETVHSVGPDGEPVFSVTPEGYGIPKGCMGYWDVQATDRCIYALYDGTTFKEIMQQRGEAKQGAKMMRVFSWSGCMGYWDVQATDRCIYALYDGTTFKEIMQQRGEAKQGAKMMRVFSWSGKLLHTYVFDRPLAGVFVDEARKTLWATDVNSDEQLVSYALK